VRKPRPTGRGFLLGNDLPAVLVEEVALFAEEHFDEGEPREPVVEVVVFEADAHIGIRAAS